MQIGSCKGFGGASRPVFLLSKPDNLIGAIIEIPFGLDAKGGA